MSCRGWRFRFRKRPSHRISRPFRCNTYSFGEFYVRDFRQNSALRQWAQIVGSDHVVTSEAALREAESGTFATNRKIPAIIRPANREQVQECLRVATEWR